MKFRLFYKIYFVVLFSVIFSVAVSVLIVGFYGYRNFREYMDQSKIHEFSWLADRLGEYYKAHGNFDAIRGYSKKMEKKMPAGREGHMFPDGPGAEGGQNEPQGPMPAGPDAQGGPGGFGPHMSDNGGGPDSGPDSGPGGEHMPQDHEQHDLGFKMFGPPDFGDKHFKKEKEDILEKIFYNEKTGLNIDALVRFQDIIAIFDKNKKMVTGARWGNGSKDYIISPIMSDGAVAGYLGIRKPPNIEQRLAEAFLSQQLYLMVFTVVLIIVVTGIFSWMFTRRVIAPVPRLITAIRKLAAHDFDIDIKKESNDELGDLAVNFGRMANDLKMYEQKQNRWISDISHELRTPLSVLLGTIEAMQDGVRKMDSATMETLHSEVDRLIHLVNELHDITMAESGGMRFNPVMMRVGDVLNEVLSFYRPRADEYGFKLELMTKNCDVMIMGDVARMQQVFINLIENSLKHAKSPGTIYVACVEDGGVVRITFEDSGPGVPDEHLPMLFDRLFRSDNSRNRMTGGSGLGLAICKYIIQRHNGRIQAFRSAMGGLKIEIDIPTEKIDE